MVKPKIILADVYKGYGRAIYFKPSKGKRIELLSVNSDVPIEVANMIAETVKKHLEYNEHWIKEKLESHG